MASCLSSGGGRPFHLDIVKSVSTSPAHSSHSSPSSTISDSNSSICVKKPRAPRKRPNQTYNEAAALLSTIYPSIFDPKKTLKPIHKKPNKQPQLDSLSFDVPDNSNSVLLPPLPIPGPAAFLLDDPMLASDFMPALPSPSSWVRRCTFRDQVGSPVSSPSLNSEVIDDDFDTESILDEESMECSGEGIDSIMGKLSVDSNVPGSSSSADSTSNDSGSVLAPNLNSNINPCLKSLIGLGLCSKIEHFNRAFKNRGNATDWYQSPSVPMKEIFTKFRPPAVAPDKKKSSKKKKSEKGEKEKREKDAVEMTDGKQLAVCGSATSQPEKDGAAPRVKLGLKLNHDDVICAWSDRGSMFSEGPDSPRPSAETLANIDLSLEGGPNGIREASVMRYKEKRRTRLFSKKIRYQVRKVNADQRPRMKGRFVRSPSLLQQALEEEKLGG
ncbi:Zinc finger protein CONSTANS-LIKE 2 [Rhynchospora pubera]|uniref:Zinc finger protein CONSTANS-LIKE 2 n=1 Tax=Rhynchospora pubera TaxID=906938 RepID=A0AAV8HLP5_9POAL|nr:Zinc finger protein CONSTANS-LIKE 2 [Rhynchospora pubera]